MRNRNGSLHCLNLKKMMSVILCGALVYSLLSPALVYAVEDEGSEQAEQYEQAEERPTGDEEESVPESTAEDGEAAAEEEPDETPDSDESGDTETEEDAPPAEDTTPDGEDETTEPEADAANADDGDAEAQEAEADEVEDTEETTTDSGYVGIMPLAQIVFGGSGTQDDPYLITNVLQLNLLQWNVNAGNSYEGEYVALGADVTISGAWTPIGSYASSADDRRPFSGIFDGNGHTVTFDGCTYNSTGTYSGVGLFGHTNGAEIYDLNLEGDLDATVAKYTYMGSVVGYATDSSFQDITSSVNITGTPGSSYQYYGGLAGYTSGSAVTIDDCSFSGTVQNTAGTVYINQYFGGLVGYAGYTTIKNSYNSGAVSDNQVSTSHYVGGIVGYGSIVTILNCANTGDISHVATSGTVYSGGIIGYITTSATSAVTNCTNFGALTGGNSAYRGSVVGSAASSTNVSVSYSYGLRDDNTTESIGTKGTNAKITCVGVFDDPTGELASTTNGTVTELPGYDAANGVSQLFYYLHYQASYLGGSGLREWEETEDGSYLPTGGIVLGAAELTVTVTLSGADGADPSALVGGDSFTLTAETAPKSDPNRGGGEQSYQWYEATSNSTSAGTALDGAVSADYSVSNASAGRYYYYVVVTNTLEQSVTVNTSAVYTVQVGAGNEDDPNAWYGEVADGFDGGTGTAADPYQIANAGELAYLAAQVSAGNTYAGKYFALTGDIRLSTTRSFPIIGTNATNYFAGYFDGQDNEITDLYIESSSAYTGLFGYVKNGTVENMCVSGEVTFTGTTAQSYIGGVVGYADGASLSGLTADIDVTVDHNAVAHVGGIAGYAKQPSEVHNCVSYGDISCRAKEASYLGGIVGNVSSGTILQDCTNTGTLEISAPNAYIGGIVGNLQSYAYLSSSVINCTNKGAVVGDKLYSNTASPTKYLGGIVGFAGGYASYPAQILNSVNLGALTGAETTPLGGIVGRTGETSTTNSYMTIANCYNTGYLGGADAPGTIIGCPSTTESRTSIYSCYWPESSTFRYAGTDTDKVSASGLGTFDTAGVIVEIDGETLAEATTLQDVLDTWAYENDSLSPRLWETDSDGDLVPTGAEVAATAPTLNLTQSGNGIYSLGEEATLSAEISATAGPGTTVVSYALYAGEFPDVDTSGTALATGTLTGVSGTRSLTLPTTEAGVKYYVLVVTVTLTYSTGASSAATISSDPLRVVVKPAGDDDFYGESAAAFAGGTGTEGDPWQIATPAQLQLMADKIAGDDAGAHFQLTADIDFNGCTWLPAGSSDKPFTGTFDGGGHTISNIAIATVSDYTGFFGYATDATVADITFSGTVSGTGAAAYIGGVAAYATSSTFQNIVSNMALEAQPTSLATSLYIGGLVAYADGTSASCTQIDNCRTNGDVNVTVRNDATSSYIYSGGLIGYIVKCTDVTNSLNTGEVSASGTVAYFYTGGVVGRAIGANFHNCANSGDLEIAMTVRSTLWSGGFGGRITGYQSARIGTLQNCANWGTVTNESGNTATQGSFLGAYTVGETRGSTVSNNGLYSVITQDVPFCGSTMTGSYDSTTNVAAIATDTWALTPDADYTFNYTRPDGTDGSDLEYALTMQLDAWLEAGTYHNTWEEKDGVLLPTGPALVTPDEVSVAVTQEEDGTLRADLTPVPKDGDSQSYVWYYTKKQDDTSVAQRIDGAEESILTPLAELYGVVQYYCVVTNTNGGYSTTATSNLFTVENLPEDAGSLWYGEVADEFAGGSGTADDPYLIATPAQLAYLAYLVNIREYTEDDAAIPSVPYASLSYRIIFDLDLNGDDGQYWTPIGEKKNTPADFTGTLDGGGHVISNLRVAATSPDNIYLGLFGYMDGTVKNLTLEHATVYFSTAETMPASGNYVGALAGYGGSNAVLENIVIDGAVSNLRESTVASGAHTGMAAGAFYGTMCDVSADGTVEAVGYGTSASPVSIGGISGYYGGTEADALLSDVAIRAETNASSSSSSYARIGGIFGYTDQSVSLSNSANTGALYVRHGTITDVGGLIGYMVPPSGAACIYNCYNSGVIDVVLDAANTFYVGGLIGRITGIIEVENCYNSGDLTTTLSSGASGSTDYCGGLVGYWYSLTGENVFANCYNSGVVAVPEGRGTRTGFIVGQKNIATIAVENIYYSAPPDEAAAGYIYPSSVVGTSAGDGVITASEMAYLDASALLYNWVVEHAERKPYYKWLREGDVPAFAGLYSVAMTPVLDCPELVVYAPDQILTEEDAITITATVTDGSELRYQWYTCEVDGDGVLVEGSMAAIEGATASSYLPEACEGTENRYYCVEVTSFNATCDQQETVVISPVITVAVGYYILLDGNVAEGETLTGDVPEKIGPVLPGGDIALPDLDATKKDAAGQGYVIKGWGTEPETADENIILSGDTFTMPGDAAQAVTVYAQWREAVRVTFDYTAPDTGVEKVLEESAYSQLAYEGEKLSMPDGTDYFRYSGYRFMGWSVTVDDVLLCGEDGAQLLLFKDDIYTLPGADIVFTATWSKLYTMSYNAGLGSLQGSAPASAQYIAGEVFCLPDQGTMTSEFYTFQGWTLSFTETGGLAEDADGGTLFPAGAEYVMPAEDIKATAQWRINCGVTFQSAMGDETDPPEITGDVPEDIVCASGESITLPDQGTLAAEGYRFLGWYSDVTETTYQAGARLVVSETMVLKAVWGQEVTLTFQDDADLGGQGEPFTVAVVAGETVKMPACPFTAPAYTGADSEYQYQFNGWKEVVLQEETEDDADAAEETVYKANSSYVSDGTAHTFVAVWRLAKLWSGGVAEEFASGTGTEDDPYFITTAEELARVGVIAQGANLTQATNRYFILDADIDLYGYNWTPINLTGGDVFDGNGHTISGMTMEGSYTYTDSATSTVASEGQYYGLFGHIGSNYANSALCTIQNLTLEDVSIDIILDEIPATNTGGNGYLPVVGGVAGYTNNCTIEDCSVSGSITVASVESEANISSYKRMCVGGIVGSAINGSEISRCTNDADIAVVANNMVTVSDVGGIVGYLTVGSTLLGMITESVNNGAIQFTSEYDVDSEYANNSFSRGTITPQKKTCVGGIVGYAEGAADVIGITQVENNGNITALCDNSGVAIGGVAGEAVVSGSQNSGDINVEVGLEMPSAMLAKTSNPYQYGVMVGGLTGVSATVTASGNTGNVSLTHALDDVPMMNAVGGVTGHLNGTVSDSYNAGDLSNTVAGSVSTSQGSVNVLTGGIAGLTGYNATLSDSEPSYIGASTASNTSATITNVHSYAQVENPAEEELNGGLSATGGIVGRAVYDTTVTNAYYLQETTDYTSVYGSLQTVAEGSDQYCTLTTTQGLPESLFRLGRAAYALEYAQADGTAATTPRGVWTQSGTAYPTLGKPSVHNAKIERTDPDISASLMVPSLGITTQVVTLYAVEGTEVTVNAEAYTDELVLLRYETTEQKVSGGTNVSTWAIYQGNVVAEIQVAHGDGAYAPISGTSFTMQDMDARVMVTQKEGEVKELVGTEFVPDEPPIDNSADENSTGGSSSVTKKPTGSGGTGTDDGTGKTAGSGTDDVQGSPDGVTGGTDPDGVPGGVPDGVSGGVVDGSDNPVGAVGGEAATVGLSSSNIPVTLAVPAPPAAAAAPAEEGGSEGEPEPVPEPEPETPTDTEIQDIFRVEPENANVITDNPALVALIVVAIALIVLLSALHNYRKHRRD